MGQLGVSKVSIIFIIALTFRVSVLRETLRWWCCFLSDLQPVYELHLYRSQGPLFKRQMPWHFPT